MRSQRPAAQLRLLDRLRGRPIEWNPLQHYRAELQAIEREGVALEDQTDAQLAERSHTLRIAVQCGAAVAPLRAQAFALVREAAMRTLALRPFDVQIVAGLVLHDGGLAELATGEGKTLAAVAAAYFEALQGKGVHLLTFNDYLAARDAGWMGPIYELLGLSVGTIQQQMTLQSRKHAYGCDVTYATAKEVGFDFLRSTLAYSAQELVQRPFHFGIVDEADSILIDEARVPLVIAGETGEMRDTEAHYAALTRQLQPDIHFTIEDNGRNANLTPAGLDFVESALGIANLLSLECVETMTRINCALHADAMLHRDVDYLVRDGRIELIDEFTGRIVEDRHLPDGLQSAVEAKEDLTRGKAGEILGSLTLQHLLQRYDKLAGMTATAHTAAEELETFYRLRTFVIPPHLPSIREDHADRVFATMEHKTLALIEEIAKQQRLGRPVLVGTVSVFESERLAGALCERGVDCHVLNAQHDSREAEIIAEAGRPGAVTISTNMAGRGTDIKLGGHDERERDAVLALGGLYVIGTNRHESRRIDDQLRGRAGRQGDPGATRFFVCLQDPLLERFDLASRLPRKLGPPTTSGEYDLAIVRGEIERTQRIVEGNHFDLRDTLSRYSEMVDQQWVQLEARRSEWFQDRGAAAQRERALGLIDRAWADHLAFVTDLRDSIHLRTIARLDPLAEFQQAIVEQFAALVARLDAQLHALRAGVAIDIDESRLRRPSSTWTYMISDDPFKDQLFAKLGGTAMGLGLVFNFPWVAAWALYRRWRKR